LSDLIREIQALAPSALIELFALDTRNLDGGTLTYFHAGTNSVVQPIVWQGIEYLPMPVEAEGFDLVTQGTSPRPKFRVANVGGLFSAEARDYDDLVNCKVTRKRTHAKYLDSVNFPNGINPDANPAELYPDQMWFVNRKTNETNEMIEWELVSAFDLKNVMLPARQIIQNSCPFIYRSAECGYTDNRFFDKSDNPTWDQRLDVCAKRFTSCERRFPAPQVVRFGGFPGAMRYADS